MDGIETGADIRAVISAVDGLTDRSPDAMVCVTGGTPWLSHTLHHAATLANLPVIVGTHEKVEGREMLFHYPKPLLGTHEDNPDGW